MRTLLLAIAQTLAKLAGANLIAVPGMTAELVDSARELCAQVQERNRGESGEYKRGQVLRSLINRHPEAKESALAMAIEVAICSM